MKRFTPLLIGLVILLGGCVSIPEGLTPVQGFKSDRYLGTWYEIARFDHRFERGLTHVSADYAAVPVPVPAPAPGAGAQDEGEIQVINRGFDAKDQVWSEAVGRARFVDTPDQGYLKVSFFGPFFGAYIVFDLDPGYRWSLVTGPSRDYLWVLSRTPQISPTLRADLISRITRAGFDADNLIFVEQGGPPPVAP